MTSTPQAFLDRMSHAIHDLSQPVTALFCVLELAEMSNARATQEPKDAGAEMQNTLQLARQEALRLSQEIARMRDLLRQEVDRCSEPTSALQERGQ
jgi:Tfp pilus assembly protein FimT